MRQIDWDFFCRLLSAPESSVTSQNSLFIDCFHGDITYFPTKATQLYTLISDHFILFQHVVRKVLIMINARISYS